MALHAQIELTWGENQLVLAGLLSDRGHAEGPRFRHVEAGPLVRSSYHAWEQVQAAGV